MYQNHERTHLAEWSENSKIYTERLYHTPVSRYRSDWVRRGVIDKTARLPDAALQAKATHHAF